MKTYILNSDGYRCHHYNNKELKCCKVLTKGESLGFWWRKDFQIATALTRATVKPGLRRVEKFKNSHRNIFRVGKYVYVLGGLKKVV